MLYAIGISENDLVRITTVSEVCVFNRVENTVEIVTYDIPNCNASFYNNRSEVFEVLKSIQEAPVGKITYESACCLDEKVKASDLKVFAFEGKEIKE